MIEMVASLMLFPVEAEALWINGVPKALAGLACHTIRDAQMIYNCFDSIFKALLFAPRRRSETQKHKGLKRLFKNGLLDIHTSWDEGTVEYSLGIAAKVLVFRELRKQINCSCFSSAALTFLLCRSGGSLCINVGRCQANHCSIFPLLAFLRHFFVIPPFNGWL